MVLQFIQIIALNLLFQTFMNHRNFVHIFQYLLAAFFAPFSFQLLIHLTNRALYEFFNAVKTKDIIALDTLARIITCEIKAN
jgi:hypothetical protein